MIEAFTHAGLDNWKQFGKYHVSFEHPAEVELLIGDSTKAAKQLGWVPKVKFKERVKILVEPIWNWRNGTKKCILCDGPCLSRVKNQLLFWQKYRATFCGRFYKMFFP